jgi:hypothetical protein
LKNARINGLREDLGVAGRRQFEIPGFEIAGPGACVRKSADEEVCVAVGRRVETAAPHGVVQQQGQDTHAAIGGGPPGRRVSTGIAAQLGVEELIERPGRVPGMAPSRAGLVAPSAFGSIFID